MRGLARLIDQHRQHERAVARWEAIRAALPERMDASSSGLTICSVAFRGKTCLDLNSRLMRHLNQGSRPPEWLLFDNNVEHAEMIDAADPRFTVVRPERRDTGMGYEHALGISALLPRVRTRFLLVQDPDCFIVCPDWLRRVPEFMLERGLGFFGTPINPRRHNSYRYFPYMVCMFVDLMRVSPRDLCFVPHVWHAPTSMIYRVRKAIAGIPKVGAAFRWLLTEQYKTNGWRIKAKFGHGHAVKHECVQPVWDINEQIPGGSLKRLLHVLTPPSVSPVPKRADYCSPVGFAAMNAPDLAALGWEEFVWNGRPFAFHIGSAHGKSGRYELQLDAVVKQFLPAQVPAA